MSDNIYESQDLLAQYLLFHYGTDRDQLPYDAGPSEGLHYPKRCVTECLDAECLPEAARALDLGCSVGRSTFELARECSEVIGVDFSAAFIEAANRIKEVGSVNFAIHEEGPAYRTVDAGVPPEIDRSRVSFETGDACALREDLGSFDVVLMANLVDRVQDPAACLAQLPGLCRPGAQLIITSPYTWLSNYTPEERWLCQEGAPTLDGLKRHLDPCFELKSTHDMPFLIREHRRKFQWSVAQASVWMRKTE